MIPAHGAIWLAWRAPPHGGAFLISRSLLPRPPPPRGRAPLFRKQKQRAAGAKFWSNHCETGGFSCILATQATAQPPPYPIWTDPTDPARRPSDRPIGPLGPYSWAPLGLGLTALRARAPPGPPVFSVFVFSRPPTAPDPPGRALTGRSKTLRPVWGFAASTWSSLAPPPGGNTFGVPAKGLARG